MKRQSLFTEVELKAMSRLPREQMVTALEGGDKEVAKKKYAELEDAFLSYPNAFSRWIAYIQEYAYKYYGHEGLAKIVRIDEILIQTLKLSMGVDEVLKCSRSAKKEMAVLIDAGNMEKATEFYDFMENGFRDLHDIYCGWTSLLLSKIYREFGVEGLEQCHRFVFENHLMHWMVEDISHDPKDRLRSWVLLMHGNFAEFSIKEDDEKFTFDLSLCGSCGRQIRAGCYEMPINLAVVKERHPITCNRGGFTVYQTHIAVFHGIMPIERIGAPWPVLICRGGASSEHCQILLYKDPLTAAPEHYEMVGKRKPESTGG